MVYCVDFVWYFPISHLCIDFLNYYYFIIHMCIQGLGHFFPSAPSLSPQPPQYPAETILPLFPILL
jgi:hypothetical protein